MSLIAVREEFARRSGRHDLVDDFAAGTYTDNGADWFLHRGQKMLDRKASFAKSYSWYKKDISTGEYKLNFRYCNAIKQVWCMGADDDRFQLEKKDYNWLRANYGDVYADLDQNTPAYYSPMVVGLGPDQIALQTSDYTGEFTYDFEDILFSDTADHLLYSGILWMPPSDDSYTISILGRFSSPPLYPSASDTLKTFWTEVHDDLLVLAGLWALEGFYRNMEGQRGYMEQILEAIGDLDKDVVEEEVQDIDQMRG